MIKKRIFTGVMAVLICFSPLSAIKAQAQGYWPEGVSVDAQAAIVMDVDTNTILYEKNIHQQMYPASITKILTALVALNNSNLDDEVTFSADAVYKNEGDTSHIARDVGEVMTMEQCLYGMMLESANECAWAIGEYIGDGDINRFIDLMNKTAKDLGCVDSNFENPNGLPDEKHCVSAYDMALISAEAYRNPKFAEITGTKTYVIPPTNKHSEETFLNNHHKMLHYYRTSKFIYPYCVGGKTGYTVAAGSTLVTYATKDDMTLVVVVLGENGDAQWKDTKELFDYYFDNFSTYKVSEQVNIGESFSQEARGALAANINLIKLEETGRVILPKTADFNDTVVEILPYEDPDNKDVVAKIKYTYSDKEVGGTNILFEDKGKISFPFANVDNGEEERAERMFYQIDYKPFAIIAGIVVALGLIVLFFVKKSSDIYLFFRRRINAKRRPRTNFKQINRSYRDRNRPKKWQKRR